MLETRHIIKSFGSLKALNGVSLKIDKSQIVGLIGPNGSGKTTLFNIVSGFYLPDAGEVYLDNRRIDGLRPHEIANKGLSRTFQVTRIIEKMTVIENLLFSPKNQIGETILDAFLSYKRIRKQEEKQLTKAFSLLKELELEKLGNELAGNLSGGQRKLLALGRIFMNDPDLILLDEPAAGVNPTLLRKLLGVIKELQERDGKTVFIIEHNMGFISDICDKVYVLDAGVIIAEGTVSEIQKNEKVLQAYLTGYADKMEIEGETPAG